VREFATKLLVVVLVFQVSVLPDTLGITLIGRGVNALVVLLFVLSLLIVAPRRRIARHSLILLIPSAVILLSMAQNIIRGMTASTLGLIAALVPWLAVLTVPFMRSFDLDRAWLTFYRFMLVFSIVALVEFAAVNVGAISPTLIATDRGTFFKGWMTIFHALQDGTVYYRMYGVFAEPGTFAMFLLPAIAYSLIMKKRGALVLFLVCVGLTYSLGGAAGLGILVVTYSFWRTRRNLLLHLVVLAIFAGIFEMLSGWFVDQYQTKALSAVLREDNVLLFARNFWITVAADPLGLPLGRVSGSLSSLSGADPIYIGSNFSFYVAFVMGGVFALGGYVLVVGVSLVATVRFFVMRDGGVMNACAFVSLPALVSFTLQRTTIFESALFAFLYVSPILFVLRGRSSAGPTNDGLSPRNLDQVV
jgi:hypothetical protein